MIAKKALGLPLKGLRFAIKSGDTFVKNASTQVTRFKTRFDERKRKWLLTSSLRQNATTLTLLSKRMF
ncbi:hypothetical protein [Psychrobacter sp. KH172YL61]|uniref:hypothetical protein n=1 Tax=Psychrobacter sp. KH172YL61 TaxID=2517899 RepID=UPI001F084A61|nr:hypothetical protein [Psychrobacter sp. KH172YL61]